MKASDAVQKTKGVVGIFVDDPLFCFEKWNRLYLISSLLM